MKSHIDKIVFKYLDNQDFVQIEKNNRIYFVNSEEDEYAQIRYNKDSGWCYIYYELIEEISYFFSLGDYDSEKVIGRWVENTLQMKVTNTLNLSTSLFLTVENTLQMKVTNTSAIIGGTDTLLRIPYK